MYNELPTTVAAEMRVEEIIAAYHSARVDGKPFDLDAILAREPDLVTAVYARLKIDNAELPTLEGGTLSGFHGASGAESDATPEIREGRHDRIAPGDFGD